VDTGDFARSPDGPLHGGREQGGEIEK